MIQKEWLDDELSNCTITVDYFTNVPTDQLTHSLTHQLNHWLIHWLPDSLSNQLDHWLIHSLTLSLIKWLVLKVPTDNDES